MKNLGNHTNFINLFIICLIINISPSFQILIKYEIKIPINEGKLSNFFFIVDGKYDVCEKWVPSLLNSILLIPNYYDISTGILIPEVNFEIRYPFLNKNRLFKLQFFKSVIIGNYSLFLGRPLFIQFNECYFGLSPNTNEFNGILEPINNLNILKENNKIKNKIFSFDKWTISDDSIISNFYLGDEHEIFRTNSGVIGKCISNNSFWGCEFNEIIFNDISIPLLNKDGYFYQIHFALETHNIIFPNIYKEIFLNKTNNLCNANIENYLTCINLFNDKEYIPIKLINEEMTMIAEIDNLNRFNSKDKSRANITRITFEDIYYIVFPLIMFKNFYIQFNGEKNIISFYTPNSSLLQIKKKNNEESSSFLIAILVIIIIVVLLSIGFIIYRIIKKRKGQNNLC